MSGSTEGVLWIRRRLTVINEESLLAEAMEMGGRIHRFDIEMEH